MSGGGILVLAESRRGELREVSLELIAPARQLAAAAAAEVALALVDPEPGRYSERLSELAVDRVLPVETAFEHFDAKVAGEALTGLIERESPLLVLLPHSVDAMSFAPAVAARLRTGFASDVVGVSWDGGPVLRRGAFGGKLVAELDFPGRETVIAMVRPGAFPAPEGAAPSPPKIAAVERVTTEPEAEHLGYEEPPAAGVDITKAPFLLSVGRGIEDEENVPRVEALAERMGATLSVSRPLVDAGWVESARQVGQSGKTVKPKLYLALGISGAVQHLAGMRDAETIVAVNNDPAAPIFRVAHYGAVADLFDVLDELEQRFPG